MVFLCLFNFLALKKQLTNERGQGLIEYLVIVGLVGIASISIMRVVSQNVQARFGNISAALGSSTRPGSLEAADASTFKKKDFTNFMNGSKDKGGAKSGGGSADDSGGGWQ